MNMLRTFFRGCLAGINQLLPAKLVDPHRTLRQRLVSFRRWTLHNHAAIRQREGDMYAMYRDEALRLHAELCDKVGQAWLDVEFTPLATNGRAGFYYGVQGAAGDTLFVKVRPAKKERHAVLAALAQGDIPHRGQSYICLAPTRAVILKNVAGIYAFPLWRRLPGAVKDRYANPIVAQGLAEFNLSFFKRERPVPAGIRVESLCLRPLTAEKFEGFSLSEDKVRPYLVRHQAIRLLWQQKQALLDALPQGLLHGDMASSNHGEHEGRLFLLDLEDACIGPLGGDLNWMLYYAERIEEAGKRHRYVDHIVKQYAAACRNLGADISDNQVSRAAHALYFKKWLFPGSGTRANIKRLAQRQHEALRFLSSMS